MSRSNAASASGVPARSLTAEPRVRGAEVGDRTTPARVVEGQQGRRAPAGRGAAAGLVDQLVREQGVDALCDGGAGQPGARARGRRG